MNPDDCVALAVLLEAELEAALKKTDLYKKILSSIRTEFTPEYNKLIRQNGADFQIEIVDDRFEVVPDVRKN